MPITLSREREARLEIQRLWEKYEDIAMHFNDLVMRLRSQSLAGIAVNSTLVGLFTRTGSTDVKLEWIAAFAIFVAMVVFWIAIFCLDVLYYNRLLIAAVSALTTLEKKLSMREDISINMSMLIEEEFKSRRFRWNYSTFAGVLWFYGRVLIVIVAGAIFSVCMYRTS